MEIPEGRARTTGQVKGLECQRNRKEANAPREDRGARSKSGGVLNPRKGVWTLLLGPCTVYRRVA